MNGREHGSVSQKIFNRRREDHRHQSVTRIRSADLSPPEPPNSPPLPYASLLFPLQSTTDSSRQPQRSADFSRQVPQRSADFSPPLPHSGLFSFPAFTSPISAFQISDFSFYRMISLQRCHRKSHPRIPPDMKTLPKKSLVKSSKSSQSIDV